MVVRMRTLAIAALAFTIAVLAGSAHGAIPPSLFNATQPSWSPDGSRIAFSGSVGGSGRSDVYTVARSGGVPANLTATDDEPNHLFPVWSPGGAYVASGSELGGPTTNHEVYSVTTAVGHVTTHVATSNAIGPISWSHDSHWLAIDDREAAIVARADGSGQRAVGIGCCGVWSKRTLRLAVSIEHTTGYGGTDIYLVNAAGHVLKRLTRPPRHRVKGAPLAIDNTPLAWSRDGSRLLFWSTRAGRVGLYVMHADGSRQTRVATAKQGDIAPRGTAVVYSGKGIWVVGANGTHAHRISPNGTAPRWSPDGQWIAYVVKRPSGASGIDLVRPDGTQRHALVGS
jgi:Tol biopolymer transport system component